MGKKDKRKKKKDKDKKKKKKKDPVILEQVAVDDADGEDTAAILDHIQPSFIEDGARVISAADLTEVLGARDELVSRFDKDETLGRFREDARMMLSLLDDYGKGRYKELPYWSVAVMAFAFHYVLKPVDIIPDSLPVIGQLDDTMVVAHCVEMVKPDLMKYRVQTLASEEG